MTPWLLAAAVMSMFFAFFLRIGAFIVVVVGVAFIFFLAGTTSGVGTLEAVGWTLLSVLIMQIGYGLGIALFAVSFQLSKKGKPASKRYPSVSGAKSVE